MKWLRWLLDILSDLDMKATFWAAIRLRKKSFSFFILPAGVIFGVSLLQNTTGMTPFEQFAVATFSLFVALLFVSLNWLVRLKSVDTRAAATFGAWGSMVTITSLQTLSVFSLFLLVSSVFFAWPMDRKAIIEALMPSNSAWRESSADSATISQRPDLSSAPQNYRDVVPIRITYDEVRRVMSENVIWVPNPQNSKVPNEPIRKKRKLNAGLPRNVKPIEQKRDLESVPELNEGESELIVAASSTPASDLRIEARNLEAIGDKAGAFRRYKTACSLGDGEACSEGRKQAEEAHDMREACKESWATNDYQSTKYRKTMCTS